MNKVTQFNYLIYARAKLVTEKFDVCNKNNKNTKARWRMRIEEIEALHQKFQLLKLEQII